MMQLTPLAAIFLFFVFTLFPCSPRAGTGEEVPVHIEADRMESNQQQSTVLFTGNVEARQGDLFIKADEMTVTYAKGNEEAQGSVAGMGNISTIAAKGGVSVSKEDWTATGERLEYSTLDKKAVLTGNTRVQQRGNVVTGEKIVLYLDQGKSIIEKSEKEGVRVKAFFYPGKKGTEKSGGDKTVSQGGDE